MFLDTYIDATARAWKTVDPEAFECAATVLSDAYATGARVFTCGNGGSASIANHFQCDHVKGIRAATGGRPAPKVISLSSNIELITAIANDIGYQDVFSFQFQSLARAGDVLVVISSSGQSDSILDVLNWASVTNVRTIALTGFDGGRARDRAEISIHVNSDNYGVVEDVHQGIMHALAQYIGQPQ